MTGEVCAIELPQRRPPLRKRRCGAAALDYVLVLVVVMPMVILLLRVSPRVMNLVYEMTSVLISWPFG